MDPIMLVGLMAVGLGAGILGALFGIGGGIVAVPLLTIIFGLSVNEAAAASLVGIIATSAGAASYYIKKGASNIRLGLLMEITTTVGAIIGASIAVYLANWVLLCIFAGMLVYSAVNMMIRTEHQHDGSSGKKDLTFEYTDENENKDREYTVENLKGGMALCTVAGAISSMTGVGGGVIKVPLMNVYMHVPIKVASATSNYMVGITAFSGAIVYFLHGDIIFDLAGALAIGAFLGAVIGTRVSKHVNAGSMRKYFSILLLIAAAFIVLEAGGFV